MEALCKMFDIIGDPHGCLYELTQLLERLNYRRKGNIYEPPDNRTLVFVGDLTDRGWSSGELLLFAMDMFAAGRARFVLGNHDDKLKRWAMGRNVQVRHGLDKTVDDIERMEIDRNKIIEFFEQMPYFLSIDDNRLIITHAAWRERFFEYSPFDKKCRSWCLFGPTTGKRLDNGLPDRIDWVANREIKESSPLIVYGHYAYDKIREENRTVGIDTSCVFGGSLSAFQYPEMKVVQIKSRQVYFENNRKV